MSVRTLALALALGLVSLPALASTCPKLMNAVDDALKTASLTEEQAAQVQKLRAEGEELHKAGRHPESEAALNEALEILGQ